MGKQFSDEEKEIIQDFITESEDLLNEIEPILFSSELITPLIANRIFRTIHTIKGASSCFDFNQISQVLHTCENILSMLRDGLNDKVEKTIFVRVLDFCRSALKEIQISFSDEAYSKDSKEIKNELEIILSQLKNERHKTTQIADAVAEIIVDQQMYTLFKTESLETLEGLETDLLKLIKNNSNEHALQEVARTIHTLKGNSAVLKLNILSDFCERLERIIKSVNAKEIIFNQFLVDFMLKNFDALKLGIERLDTNTGQIVGWDARLLLKLLDEFCQQNITSDEKEILSLEMKEKSNTNNSSTEIERKDIRIDVHKLDILNDLIGEMLIARTMMIKEAGVNNSKNAQLKKTFHFFSKVLGELQGTSMSMRMTPVGGLFNKMYRVVHDLVLKTGKEIKIDFYGEKTEMDKSLIESIKDPLLHMVRNAADHGLESTEERISLGKSPQGIIEIGAKNEAGEIWIIVKDNGRGLDSEKLIKKAITSGLLTLQESTQLSSDEIYRLIFTPGFSTASIVTDISGRGVGMDVVMQNIKKLKGRVDIDTKLGVGTTFTIKIPLTLAIIDGMLISTAGIKFTVAIDSIRETIKVSRQAIDTVLTTSKMIKVRNKMIPIIHLANLLGIEKDVKEINDHQFLVIVENAGGLLALLIDELIGQHQTIIKSVPKYFSQNHYLSGCSIQGDGDVGLILDIPSIFESTARDISA